jgi:hypothetical protein
MKSRVNFRCMLRAAVLGQALFASWIAANAATIVVNSTADPAGYNQTITIAQLGATVTLRDAFNAAINAGGVNTITFDPSLAGQTIYLSQKSTADAGSAIDMSYQGFENQYDLTIQGLAGNQGVTLAAGSPGMRLFLCESDVYQNSLTLNDLTISGWQNTNGWGGAIMNSSAVLTLNRCTIANNSAIFGAAIYNNTEAQTTLNNCTVANNTATSEGGAFYDYFGALNLNFCTVTGNSAPEAGGIYVYATPYPVLADTIVADNISPYYSEIMGNVDAASHHNLTSADGGGTNPAGGMINGVNGNIVGLHPQLGALASNGGPTMTMALTTASPAVRAGVGISGINTDQRGTARSESGAVDIGAYQLPGNYLPTSVTLSMPAKYPYGHPPQATVYASYTGASLPLYGTISYAVDGSSANSLTLANPNNSTSGQVDFAPASNLAIGTHTISLTFAPDNYDEPTLAWISSYLNSSFTVTQAVPTITLTGTTVAYNGAQQSVQGDVRGALGEDLGAPFIRYYGGSDTNLAYPLSSPPSAVGTYIVTAQYFGDAQYLATQIQGTFSILDPQAYGLVVNTLQDGLNLGGGLISLRQAVTNAILLGGHQTVTFDPNLFSFGPATVSINGYNDPIQMSAYSGGVSIHGPGPKLLTINGNGHTGVFQIFGESAEVDGMTITNGYSGNGGGAIYMGGGASLSVSNVVFAGNGCDPSFGGGGAIAAYSPLNIINSTFIGNRAASGGALYPQNSIAITNCTFIANQADTGGAIYESFGAMAVVNSTFFNNRATNGDGGGIELNSYQSLAPLILNSTFCSNSAPAGAGGGIALGQSLNHAVSIYNSIVCGNTAATNGNVDLYTNIDLPYQSATAVTTGSLIDLDPAVIFATVAPADNGGFTPTMALKAGSPAVDAGNNSLVPAGLAFDQRGYPRINNGTVDVGAVEFTPAPTLFIYHTGKILLTWPVGAAGFHLQSTTDLSSNTWTDVTATVTQSNQFNQVLIDSPGATAFFRLSL